jgi:glucokinase
MHYLGVDIGGTTIKAGLVNETGRVVESRTAATAADDLNLFLSKLSELITDFQTSYTIDAIGVGVPGLLHSKTHVIEVSPNIPCLDHVNLEEKLADQVHIPVVTQNDANAGAYGEFVCGAGAGSENMVYLTIGTGFGSGLILNRKLFVGTTGYAGEVGHTVIEPYGVRCSCGRIGCVETVISSAAMVNLARSRGKPEWVTSKIIFEALQRGDPEARAIFEKTGYYLGITCANLMNILNPDMIIIGGGVMASGSALLDPAIEEARRRAFRSAFDSCRIVQSTLGRNSGIIGAAMLARDR